MILSEIIILGRGQVVNVCLIHERKSEKSREMRREYE